MLIVRRKDMDFSYEVDARIHSTCVDCCTLMRVLEDCQISGKELAWASNRAKQIACSEMENMENIGMGAANCEIS